MTKSEAHTAAHRIDGYMIPRPGESLEATFSRAKQEAVFHLKQDLEDVDNMSWKHYHDAMIEIRNAS
jgi:hypothetical protein